MKQEKLSTGDLEVLYQTHKDEVLRYLASLTHDSDEAHDLLQAVFMRLIRKVEDGKMRKDTARAYIFRSAHNLFIDSYRRGQTEARAYEQHAETAAAFEELHEPRVAIQDALLKLMESGKLTARQGEILELRFLALMEVEDVAKKMGIGAHTVYREIRRILQVARTSFLALGLTMQDFEEVKE